MFLHFFNHVHRRVVIIYFASRPTMLRQAAICARDEPLPPHTTPTTGPWPSALTPADSSSAGWYSGARDAAQLGSTRRRWSSNTAGAVCEGCRATHVRETRRRHWPNPRTVGPAVPAGVLTGKAAQRFDTLPVRHCHTKSGALERGFKHSRGDGLV